MDAFLNEPMAFRGILWGQRRDSLTGRTFLPVREDGDITSFRLEGDLLEIDDAKVSDIVYSFYRNRFYRVSVIIDSREEFKKIRKHFFDTHGEGVSVSHEEEETESCYWAGAELDICLRYSEKSGGRIEYSFRPIHKREEKEAKIKAIHDWEK
ncbi:MAG: hypothetical protein A4E74_01371 [Syntrophus sp. PtaB.Bin075]|nr:MAG: hypothetical protein A4E74_01371 [Syntrophus sp. PtaB.Bin075]